MINSLMSSGYYRQVLLSSIFALLFVNGISYPSRASQISVDIKSGSFSYRLKKDANKERCSRDGIQGQTFALAEIAALCLLENSKVMLKDCPVSKTKKANIPVKGPNKNYLISKECGIASTLSGDKLMPGGWDSSIPFIVSPRYTKILDVNPELKWNDIGNGASYKVELYQIDSLGRRISIWNNPQEHISNVKAGEVVIMPYPQNEKPLEVGDYELAVTSNDGKDSAMEKESERYGPRFGISRRRFTLIDQSKASEIKDDAKALREYKHPVNQIAELDVANFYERGGFYVDAIQELEIALKVKGDNQSAIYQELGHLYQQLGLVILAVKSYARAGDNDTLLKLCKAIPSKLTPPEECPK
jgi:hypothetical protein